MYAVDYDKLVAFKSRRDELNITSFKNNTIEGNINARSDSTLMVTIPYEKGWNIYVDNKKVDYYEVIDTFVGFDISEGEHKIKMVYEVPGLNLGIGVSLISLTTLIVYELKRKRIS